MALLHRIPPILRNFYVITAIAFFIWMLFFDINDVINQFFSRKKLHELESEKAYYIEKIEEVKKEREEILSKPHLLEKFAREKYLMKKKNEDVFILAEE